MPTNDIAVLIFSFVSLCVFIVCAASIIVQLRIHDLKCELQNDYDKACLKLKKEWVATGEKYTDEISALKIKMKSLEKQLLKQNSHAEEDDLSSAAVLGKKSQQDEAPQINFTDLLTRNDRLH